ncbi:rho GTPase-activating protein 31 [Pimephales promelas]|uniref:rho GTPase-activating protein 31 n=1 Tax=Pimephales promelas TaxID=90988 RepID=UPI001955C8C1|nr:rho GTPase-activating protein 31 [Pimephales promelas]XP_039517991.1 rho GTPase-activating protein 31 [Pimephales promelas]KAG1957827.1 rho GTPase-activating protein [Pimephales promelas]
MKNKAAKLKSKRKGTENAFGCDLTEHLQNSGQDVPHVLKTCADFIEKHGIVDGIYRLSGITSNIQRLRQEFCSELCPDLTKEVYLQDIHCVGSLCKLYFRELPIPLLTYELYKKFTAAVSVKEEQEQLRNIRSAIHQLPVSHFRTLEYLTKHLAHLATLSHQTNMHARNLALVWAPNLLRSKEVEVPSCNGDIAFQEVRIQQSVVEFILNHTQQIFNQDLQPSKSREGPSMACGEKYATLPASTQCGPMKLMSLEEAQARSLSPNHPAMRERQRENSLPDTSTAAMYHTVIDLSDSRRKFSGKSKKWKSIFSLGRSVIDSKGKLSRNGSVFMRGQNSSEKTAIRPSKSMDSLCSFPAADEDKIPTEGSNGIFVPVLKSRTLGSDIDYNLNNKDSDLDPHNASGGCPSEKREGALSASSSSPSLSPLQKTLPEQLKVFKGDERSGCQPTSPKNRRMLYSGSANNGSSRPSFPGSLFPLESSPRHQRKALNISEPFAVSVPLRVSAVINSNSTPCRAPGKERDKGLGGLFKPPKEAGPLEAHRRESIGTAGFPVHIGGSSGNFTFTDWETGLAAHTNSTGYREHPLSDSSGGSGCSIYSNSSSFPMEKEDQTGERDITDAITLGTAKRKDAEVRELIASVENFEPQVSSETKAIGEELETTSTQQEITQLDKLEVLNEVSSSDMHQKVSVTEAKTNVLDEQVKPSFTKMTGNEDKLSGQTRRRSSLPTNTASPKGLFIDLTKNVMFDHPGATTFNSAMKHLPERLLSCDGGWNYLENDVDWTDHKRPESQNIITTSLQLSPFLHLKETDILQDAEPCSEEELRSGIISNKESLVTNDICEKGNKDVIDEPKKLDLAGRIKGSLERLSTCLNEQHLTLEVLHQDDVDTWGSNLGGLDQVEPWEDLCSAKQWVTSPLHSPTLEDLLPMPKETMSQILDKPKGEELPTSKKDDAKEPTVLIDITSSQTEAALTSCELVNPTGNQNADTGVACSAQVMDGNKWVGDKEDKLEVKILKTLTDSDKTTELQDLSKAKPKRSQRFHRQTSHEFCIVERSQENIKPKLRPCSLNLDLGHQGFRDISNSQYLKSAKQSIAQEWVTHGSSSLELELFLSGSKAPMRRNSAPVSVSSVRTAFMIKTCQAKAVPVIPPKVQYSHIPHALLEGSTDQVSKSTPEKKPAKGKLGKPGSALPLQKVKDHREELPSGEPPSVVQRQNATCNFFKPTSIPDLPVLRRKRSANGDTFMDRPRPERSTLLQRSSFRNRPRPQSLILFSPPFPIMDYPPVGQDGKLGLSPIKAEASPFDVYAKELAENLKTPEGVTLRNKMTLPKSGQRLETSTSCFYQPQRRSMIFDNRSNRQIE